jgi:5'-3' exonuclease
MLLIDLNQVMISNLMMQVGSSSKVKLDEGLVRHMVLNTIRINVKNFRSYGKVIIACDNKKYWRRDYFPNYKAGRKKVREASVHDWNLIFECLNKIKQELKEFSPYTVLDVERAEADDIIAVLSSHFSDKEKIMILSNDKDFIQLQKCSNVEQYSPILKKKINGKDASLHLKEMIIRGDSSDGIPNILSQDDVFLVEGKKQGSITKKKLEQWLYQEPEFFCNDEMMRNYSRNQLMIDFEFIPNDIKTNILQSFEETKPASKQNFLNYMIKNRLNNLMEVFDDF